MTKERRVFIYEGEHVSPDSADDTKTLFESEAFQGVDVRVGQFNFNLDQLERITPVFVVPGGYAFYMVNTLSPQFSHVQTALKGSYHYVGICAGAYVATNWSFPLAFDKDRSNTSSPYLYSEYPERPFSRMSFVNTAAWGPFHPNEEPPQNQWKRPNESCLGFYSQATPIKFFNTNSYVQSLYVEGCAFRNVSEDYEKIAHYAGAEQYSFKQRQDGGETFSEEYSVPAEEMHAIIRKKAKPDQKEGGVLLSGVHIEATVSQSKLLDNVGMLGGKIKSLRSDVIDRIKTDQEESREQVETVLKETLGW